MTKGLTTRTRTTKLCLGLREQSSQSKIRRKMEVVKIDRGSELNRKRINSIEVDVWFHVQDEIIPAHRLIVALHSDYLKALTNPLSSFVER